MVSLPSIRYLAVRFASEVAELIEMYRIDYAGAANLISKRRFTQLPADCATLIYSPIATRPPSGRAFTNAPERYDLYRDFVQIVQTVESVIAMMRSTRLQLPITPGDCTIINDLDQELYQLYLFHEQFSVVGRRYFIQQAWRFTALICISAIPRLHRIDPTELNEEVLQKLRVLLDNTVEWSDIINVFTFSLLKGQAIQPLEMAKKLRPLMNKAIYLTWADWRTVKLRLLGFFVHDEICRGPLQNIWRNRLGFSVYNVTTNL